MPKSKNNPTILYLSTFPPRECGIATFTQDLTRAIRKKFNPTLTPGILAINHESTDIYNYQKNVVDQIIASNIDDYITTAHKINDNDSIRLVHIQHEFGIFGGEYGNHLIPLMQVIEKPVVITFHAVLAPNNNDIKHTVQFLIKKAAAVIVMNKFSKEILVKQYGGERSKIFVIAHGIPQASFSDGGREKKKLGLENKIVLSTFGLLSPSKGVEYAIRALPGVVKYFPDVLYLIIGATHPLVRKYDGESYRNFLKREINRLKLKNNVKFYNKFLELPEIVSYLKASDIYLSTALNKEQSVSGTLSYALGCGRPVVATASSYAKSIVSPARGILVELKNARAVRKALLFILKDPALKNQMANNAFVETRHMTWPNVALAHFNLYQNYVNLTEEEKKLPVITLKHIRALTDDFGIIQFAKNTKPDLHYGYALDDNARAAIVVAQHWADSKKEKDLDLLKIYLNFIKFVQGPKGVFANLVNAERQIEKAESSEDAQGRAIWTLGYLASQESLPSSLREQAEAILKKVLAGAKAIQSPRAIAFAILGLYHYNQNSSEPIPKNLFKQFARRQLNLFQKTASENWPWFENSLTYSNSKLPESLFYAYLDSGNKQYLEAGEKSLNFLTNITFRKDCFEAIGQNGWYFRNGKRAFFDQQPEETSSMVQTLVLAYQTTKKPIYKKRAVQAFQWFLGKNHLKQMVYDESSGGCYDGLGRHALNMNQGAESTISYLLARLSLEQII